MTWSVPAQINAHTTSHASDPRARGVTGSPVLGTKTAGGLPITNAGSRIENNTASSPTGAQDLAHWEFLATGGHDVSSETKVLIWVFQYNSGNRIQCATKLNEGVVMRLGSGSGNPPINLKEYEIGGNDTEIGSSMTGPVAMVIDLNDTSHEVQGGTFDNTDVQTYGMGGVRFNLSGTSTQYFIVTGAYLFDTDADGDMPTFTGTSSNNWDNLARLVLGTSYANRNSYGWIEKNGNIFKVYSPWQIGDGTTATTFDDEGVTVLGPPNNDSDDPRFRITSQAMRSYIRLRNNAGDVVTLSGTYNYIDSNLPPLDFNVSNASVINLAGSTWIGRGQVDLGSSCTGNVTFDRCSKVVPTDASKLTGSVFKDQEGSIGLELQAAVNITNMDFSGYSGAHAIQITTAGNYTLTNCSFDGSGTNDIECTNATGNVSIKVVGDIVPTVTQTGAGTHTISRDVNVQVRVFDLFDNQPVLNAVVFAEASVGGELPQSESVSITRSGSTATVSHTAHGIITDNSRVVIRGCDQNEYNGMHVISIVDDNSYTYTVSGTPATPATGTPESSAVVFYGLTNISGIFNATVDTVREDSPDFFGRIRKSTAGGILYRTTNILGTVDETDGFSGDFYLERD